MPFPTHRKSAGQEFSSIKGVSFYFERSFLLFWIAEFNFSGNGKERESCVLIQGQQREFLVMHAELLQTDGFESHGCEHREPLGLVGHLQ